MRLLGIKENVFIDEVLLNEGGCEVFLVDINIDILFILMKSNMSKCEISFFSHKRLWIKIDYMLSQMSDDSYFYEIFSGDDPTFINVNNIDFVEGPTLRNNPKVQVDTIEDDDDQSSQWILDSFHVGQGMCSVFHNDDTGFIIDCGAGTPIFKNNYKNKKTPMVNDLLNVLAKITKNDRKIPLIVSHSDSDHWRLIDWDPGILKKIEKIYVPDKVTSLATKSKHIIGIVYPISDTTFMRTKSGSTYISVYRSEPKHRDNNGECLVCLVEINGKKALLAGDYVYSRMLTDKNVNIANIGTYKYQAVVVPHHGDEASSRDIVEPFSDEAVAFFSAGGRYGHPTWASIGNHMHKGYTEISDPTCGYIKIISLLS